MTTPSDGWNESAGAWIAALGEEGDYGRKYVLDPPMIERIQGRGFQTALDIGCGEGRFCRIMQQHGIATVGIDPTRSLIARAKLLDAYGEYRIGRAERLDVADQSFDLVVSYLSLIDIPDLAGAASEMVRVMKPGATLLIANLTSFSTAGAPSGWRRDASGRGGFCIDNYLDHRAVTVSWNGITVTNWHRPLSSYLCAFLERGLELKHFAEPQPIGGDPLVGAKYRRVPWFNLHEWRKPADGRERA